MIYLRNIKYIDRKDLNITINNSNEIQSIRKNIAQGDIYIVKNYYGVTKCDSIVDYLKKVGQSSFPNYHPIEKGAPNFHRMNKLDPRAYVKGAFHQFNYFPWNHDYFDLFGTCEDAYALKNLISNQKADKFLKNEPEEGCTARIAVQFYPRGYGLLNKHTDPVDIHQLTVPIMILSEKGKDFNTGGGYVEKKNGDKVILDDICSKGDIIYFSAEIPHGVLPIDPIVNLPWINFQGRWMLLLAVNKVAGNTLIADASDLET